MTHSSEIKVRGYSTVFVHGTRGFTLRSDGVCGAAFFRRYRDAVEWRRDLKRHTLLESKVVPVEVTMCVVPPKRRKKR